MAENDTHMHDDGFRQDDDQKTHEVPRVRVEPSQVVVEPSMKSKKPRSGISRFFASFLGGVLGAVAIVAVLQLSGNLGAASMDSRLTPQTQPENITINAHDTNATLAEAVAKKDLPSVVSVKVSTKQGGGVGSGVIIDKEGYILTNYHVVKGARAMMVTMNDKNYEAKVVGSDPSSDLAVIKADFKGIEVTPIQVGDSSKLKVGEWVMSIGSPFGLDQSVSTGIVSSLYRNTMLPGYDGDTIYTNLIQTDAAVNPGNSGGALVNSKGELIGINSIIESASGSSSGVGFAIPSNYAMEVAKTLMEGKQVLHPYIGLRLLTITPEIARRYHLPVNQGAYIQEVIPGGPGAAAGLKSGDIIIGIDGKQITSADALILSIRSHKVGDEIDVTYVRGSDRKNVKVKLTSDENIRKSPDVNSEPLDIQDLLP